MKFKILFILLFTITLFPQKKNFTLEQVILQGSKLRPKQLTQLQWIPGTSSFSYFEKNNGRFYLFKTDAGSLSKERVLEVDSFKELLKEKGFGEIGFPVISWEKDNIFTFWIGNKLLRYDITGKIITLLNELPAEAENMDVAGNYFAAYTKGNNLYISINGNETAVTNENDKEIVNGKSVHRNEFGITKGTFWSPGFNFLAFYRMDETMVTDYPILDLSKRPAKIETTKYPMAGMTSHNVTIGIYNLSSSKTVFLRTGEPKDQYLTSVTWGPQEKYLYVGHLNRDQNFFQLKQYDISTGELVKILFEEKDNEYFEPLNPMYFVPGNNSKFIWLSRRDGWRHMYLYDTNGKLIKQLTKGEWEIKKFQGFDENGIRAYFTSTNNGVLNTNYSYVNLESGIVENPVEEEGSHSVKRSSDSRFLLDAFSSKTIPHRVDLIDISKEEKKNIYTAENPLAEYNMGNTVVGTIKSSDNSDLYYRIITPPGFDSLKKYPVLVYVYGGPHDQLITNEWLQGANLWLNYMAQQDFVIFSLDNRGTNNRGENFEQVTFRNLGRYEIEDQIDGINYLSELSFIDTSRIGVYGWSYGGFMTVSLMTRAPEYFKVGVAGGAVIDWSFYEVMYTERYMDTPESNPEGYRESNLMNYVDELKGKLLFVHGTSDPTVVWQNTLLYAEKAAHLNRELDYYPYVGHGHGVKGQDALHLYTKITKYFKDNL